MEKLFRLFLACFLIAGTGACSDDEPSSAMRINGGESFLSLDALARSGTISVSSLTPWRVTKAARDTWFTLSMDSGPAGDSEVGVSFSKNDGPARSAVVVFSAGDALYQFRLSQSGHNVGFEQADYYFYMTVASLPALYMGMHVLSHDKPSWFFYARSKTFDPAQFPANVTVMTGDRNNSAASQAEMLDMRERMMRRIREINAADPTAVFGFYVDDLRCRLGYDWFVEQGIDSARVKVSMVSDGTATYDSFFDYFGDPATAEQNWNTYAAEVEARDWNHGGRYPETRAQVEFESWTWPFYLATRPDYRLVLQDGSLLEPNTGFVGEKLAEMDIESVLPYQLLQSLTPAAQTQFYRMAEFNYDRFASLFDDSDKKNLVIIGTNASALNIAEQQRAYVARIVEQYGGEYDIFFKPHPADTSSADYEQRFGLTLLPGQMPFEIFVWALMDNVDVIGGYSSTVFLTVPVEKVRFIFAPDAASLIRPLNILFRDAVNVEWMQ